MNGEFYASIVDGYIALNASTEQAFVGALYVHSSGAAVGLDAAALPFGSRASVHRDSSTTVEFGVEDPQQRISFEGQLVTSVSYAGAEADAVNDLTVAFGLDRCLSYPVTLPIGAENAIDYVRCDSDTPPTSFTHEGTLPPRYFASIVDGQLAIHGNLHAVGGLFVQSSTPSLDLDDAMLPFDATAINYASGPSEVTFGTQQLSERVSLEGRTLTSVSYSGTETDAMTDLVVEVGLTPCGSKPFTLPIGVDNAFLELTCNETDPTTTFSSYGLLPPRKYATIVDGQLAFQGDISSLGGIYVASDTPALSLGDARLPFGADVDYVDTNTAQEIKFGVATTADRVQLEGQTITSIAYSGSEADAVDGLHIELGLGQCGSSPATLPVGVENGIASFVCNTTDPATSFTRIGSLEGNGTVGGEGIYATVFDGNLVLNGRIEDLSAIHATSSRRSLGLDASSLAPFAGTASVLRSDTRAVSLGVLQAENRVTIEGVTQTAIEYSRPRREAESDLSLDVRLAACGASAASVPIGIDNAVAQLVCDGGSTGQTTLPDYATVKDGVIVISGRVR